MLRPSPSSPVYTIKSTLLGEWEADSRTKVQGPHETLDVGSCTTPGVRESTSPQEDSGTQSHEDIAGGIDEELEVNRVAEVPVPQYKDICL